MVKMHRRKIPLIRLIRDAKKQTITQLSLEDLDRINTPIQHSSILPTKILLKDVERYRENDIRLRYELDLAKQLTISVKQNQPKRYSTTIYSPFVTQGTTVPT